MMNLSCIISVAFAGIGAVDPAMFADINLVLRPIAEPVVIECSLSGI